MRKRLRSHSPVHYQTILPKTDLFASVRGEFGGAGVGDASGATHRPNESDGRPLRLSAR